MVDDEALGATKNILDKREAILRACLLYTSDAADERSSVDLGGRRIIKKKKILATLHSSLSTSQPVPYHHRKKVCNKDI